MSETIDNLEDLKSQREDLRERLDAIEADYRRGLEADSEERAQQLENAEVLEGIAKSTSEQLRTIEAKIAALEA